MIIKKIILWYRRNFKSFTLQECLDMNLIFVNNIWGDPINQINSRSIWRDKKDNIYKCNEIFDAWNF